MAPISKTRPPRLLPRRFSHAGRNHHRSADISRVRTTHRIGTVRYGQTGLDDRPRARQHVYGHLQEHRDVRAICSQPHQNLPLILKVADCRRKSCISARRWTSGMVRMGRTGISKALGMLSPVVFQATPFTLTTVLQVKIRRTMPGISSGM